MAKIQKSILTSDWLEIKKMYEENTNGKDEYGENFPINGEFDELTRSFLDKIAILTEKLGWECVVDGVKMNLWKERIWSVIENGGLLAPIAWKDDLAADEEEARKKAEEEAFYQDEFEDIDDYEPTDEELMETERF
tara:strand:- start:1177 stop:1584 length:408 start_codon:yes stop_codon:yes gene_type:complete